MFDNELREPVVHPTQPYSKPEIVELGEIVTLTQGTS